MLFMDIITWEPKDNDEVTRRYSEWSWPDSVEVISEWTDLSTCRYVAVVDIKDSESYAIAALPWKDICHIETVPVMETSKLMAMMSEYV
ncbi:DUF3303 domain-containing protein [Methanococcoides sp. LMO-2]|uniref:DUF3303 family protein n=1 Tax=Methanococcoides cohabitans TaxID=3136559 RepID=A0ABU9KRL8_9EURY